MTISEQGLQLLIDREGSRNQAYLDTVGVWTIGVGHTGPEVRPGLAWTDDQVKAVLVLDLDRFEQAVNDGVTVELAQHQFDALVSFSFNVGVAAFHNSTLLSELNKGNVAGAIAQFDVWNKPVGIVSRRSGEREQFKGAVFQARVP